MKKLDRKYIVGAVAGFCIACVMVGCMGLRSEPEPLTNTLEYSQNVELSRRFDLLEDRLDALNVWAESMSTYVHTQEVYLRQLWASQDLMHSWFTALLEEGGELDQFDIRIKSLEAGRE